MFSSIHSRLLHVSFMFPQLRFCVYNYTVSVQRESVHTEVFPFLNDLWKSIKANNCSISMRLFFFPHKGWSDLISVNPLQGWSRECCFAFLNQSFQTFSTEHLSNISSIHPHLSQTWERTNDLKARDKTTDTHKRTRSTKTTLSLLTHSPGRPTGNQVNVFPTRSLNTWQTS